MNTNNELRDRAIALGLCDLWQSRWTEDKTPQQLIDMYKRGIDFALENDYPSNEYITQHFDKELLHGNNIYIDEVLSIENPSNDCVILGDCRGKLIFTEFSVRDIYVKGGSDIEVEASGFSRIFVNVYGEVKVNFIQNDLSKISLYRHD